jgi:predicted DNA-binding transcriptional regulator YafY
MTGPDLAAKLGISLRTLYRDIATLQDQGADIRGEPGLGYVLRPGFTLPPLMFSFDEIEALALGARWVAARGDTKLSADADSAVAKIRAVLPPDRRDAIDSASLTVPGRDDAAPVDLSLVRTAIRQGNKLEIAYRDAAGVATRRTIWPLLVGFFERALVVAAWCELREDYRGFRVDRIEEAVATGVPVPRARAGMLKEWREKQGISTAAGN